MRKLSLSLLASGIALWASAASAQTAGGPPPGAHMPPPGARPAQPAGHTWQSGGHTGQAVGMTGHAPMGHNTTTVVRHGGGGTMHGGGSMHGGGTMHRGGHHPHRIQRGFFIPHFWFGPQFQINNWQMYGFGAPGAGQRWVRYYNDAYLVDQGGRVVDAREGLDWDRYGEQWEVADGIPAYRGSRAYAPGAEDYAWSQSHGGGYGPPMGYGGGYGYSYGGGYGYGAYAYPIVIETITTSGGMSYYEEVTEEVVRVRPRVRRARCVCPPPRPARPRPAPVRRPPPGERG